MTGSGDANDNSKRLVREDLDIETDKIVVVGGFADSAYLVQHLKQTINDRNKRDLSDICAIFPPRHASANGAA
ncbi:hypothetical protein E8E13_000037, partial [Curvularia kusanoi]